MKGLSQSLIQLSYFGVNCTEFLDHRWLQSRIVAPFPLTVNVNITVNAYSLSTCTG